MIAKAFFHRKTPGTRRCTKGLNFFLRESLCSSRLSARLHLFFHQVNRHNEMPVAFVYSFFRETGGGMEDY